MTKVVNPFERNLSDAYTAAEHCACVCSTGAASNQADGRVDAPCSCTCACGNSGATTRSANNHSAFSYGHN